MVIDIEAKEYTQAEAEALLDYLFRYYFDRPRKMGETGEMVTSLGDGKMLALIQQLHDERSEFPPLVVALENRT